MTKPYLKLHTSSANIKAGEIFPVDIYLDSQNNPIISVDTYVKFDNSIFDLANYSTPDVKKTDLFTAVGARITGPQEIYVYAINSGSAITNSGKIATVYFQAKKTGVADIDISCDNNVKTSQIIKNDKDFSNIIDCAETKRQNLTTVVSETQNVLGATDSKQSASIWVIVMLIFFGALLLSLFVYKYKKLIKKIIK